MKKHLDYEFTRPLFRPSPQFRIVRLGGSAARKQTDELRILRGMLLQSEDMYPGIDKWYCEKVLPGLRSSERVAYLAFEDEQPVASAVLKLGEHAKFCHVKISREFRDLKLGQMIFTQMALQARHQKGIKDIHFTLPEGLWCERESFFRSFGFANAFKASRQYRNGEDELFCSAPIYEVWRSALEKLHLLREFSVAGFSFSDKILLSVQPNYANLIFSGKKQVEIRKKFSRRWVGRKAVVYGTQPLGSLIGEVTLSNVTPGSPSAIWEQYGARSGCTFKEFEDYVGDSEEVYAIELSNVYPYLAPIGIAQISHLVREELRPPQSFLDAKLDGSPWGKAISVVDLMHSWYEPNEVTQVR